MRITKERRKSYNVVAMDISLSQRKLSDYEIGLFPRFQFCNSDGGFTLSSARDHPRSEKTQPAEQIHTEPRIVRQTCLSRVAIYYGFHITTRATAAWVTPRYIYHSELISILRTSLNGKHMAVIRNSRLMTVSLEVNTE